MRRTTAAGLSSLILVSAYIQLFLGIFYGAPNVRMLVLVISTTACVILALAMVPTLVRASGILSARNPLVIALLATSLLTWAIALAPPFAGWGWAFLVAISGGMLSCLVSGLKSGAVIVATIGTIALGGISQWVGHDHTAVGVVASISGTQNRDIVTVAGAVLMTVLPRTTVWVLRVVLRLEEARQTASELAVATERLRFATDLHDIQGHHLQVIALKGELAERRLLAGEPELAARELADIRGIAQAALEDTRAVVNDYRTVTVAVEARNAAAVLRSAGIDCEARIDAPDLPPPMGAVFAVAIREAATNILRHSTATAASLELILSNDEEYRLTITSNGSSARRSGGTGISGIGERAAAWNGTVQTRRDDDTFTLVVRIPAPAVQRTEAGR